MALLLCSRNDTVRKKWFLALSPKWKMHQAATVEELFSLWKQFQVEIILLHRSMIDEQQLKEICAKRAGTKIFVFSDRPDDQEGSSCLQFGCVGYANTYIAAGRLQAAIETVESGLVWIGSNLMSYLISNLPDNLEDELKADGREKTADPLIGDLSKREYQIARLVADGLNNMQIANELDITERTVKAHLSSIYTKTQTKGRLNLALLMKKG